MIKFKNVAGDSFLAVGTIQRKFALNGEKSLSGVLYDGDDVLNNIDKGWSLEFDGEPYIVSYFERNDNDNTLSFDAVHKFFWVMSKSVMYSQTSGSHTIQWYLDQIFANTGYTYALNFSPNAIAKDNWGMKAKLSLFNDIISSINGEFEINGTLISIFEKVGSDLSTIVRYGFNLSDMSIENDAAGFVTYGEGFGAYEDQQNQSGPRLHATYTSPLASVYGILQAEPVDDQRYTLESSIIGAIKAKVDASFSVSIKLSLYDLTAAGYPYKMAHVGDWLMAIDEKLDFKQRIRIISIDDEFDANGNRISYTVTAGNIGVVQKYQDANASLSSQVSNALDTANKASDDANIALISANGKNTSYYVDSVDALPTTANEGDMGWVQSGDGRVLYIYTKKPDGTYYWEKRIDPEMSEQIEAGVDKAVTDAKTYSDQAIATNRAQVDAEIKTVNDKTAQLETEQAELDTKAQGYANQALADAKADTQATAAQTAKDAQDALAAAKTDLTDKVEAETNARVSAVSELDTKAQGYADTAKNDAISTANTSIAKEVTDRQKAVTDLDAKSTAAINQARTDAQSAIDALSTGDRNYILDTNNPKRLVGQGISSFDYYDQAKLYKPLQTWGVAESPYLISFDWDLDTPLSEDMDASVFFNQSPWQEQRYIIPANQKSGHETFSIKLNAGLLTSSQDVTSLTFRVNSQLSQGNALTISNLYMKSGNLTTDWTQAPEDVVLDYTTKDNIISQSLTQYQVTNDGKVSKAQSDATQALNEVSTKVSQTTFDTKTGDLDSKYTAVKQTADQATTDIVAIKSTNDSQDTKINTIQSDVSGTKQSISDIQTEQGNQSTKINTIQSDVSGTKQDISDIQDANGVQDGKIASISTTVDGLSSSFSAYKTTNDGKVAKAQADITTNTTAISQKVSQTDYDTKTGQLQADLTSTTTTANGNKTDILAIKATNDSQDARMTTIESDANGVKTTVSNLQTTQGQQAGSISTLQQRADGFDATVTKVNGLSVGGRNYVLDTGNPKTQQGNGQDNQDLYNSAVFSSPIKNWGVTDTDYTVSFDWELTSPLTDPMQLGVFFNQAPWEPIYNTVPSGQKNGHISYTFKLLTGILTATPEITGLNFRVNSQLAAGNSITYSHLTFEQGNLPKDWTPAPEDLESATAKAQLTADQAALSINNYKTDADGRISKAQADIVTNANAITTKVSQSDYDQKTGDLESKVSTAQQTADGAVTTIGNYKQSNDGRVSAAESKIDQNTHDITTKVSQTDYDQKTGELSGEISSVRQTAGEISQSVSNMQTQVNALNQVNLINNSDFRPDLSGWAVQNPQAGTVTTGEYDYSGKVMVLNNTAGGILRVSSVPIAITGATSVSYDFNYYIFSLGDGGVVQSQLSYLDSNMNEIGGSYPGAINLATGAVGSWQKRTVPNLELTPPSGAVYITFVFDVRGAGTRAGINRPILVKGSTVGDYIAGQYVNNDKISVVSQKVDSITSIVSDPTIGLSTRVQTAEGTLSRVTGADIPNLQKATFWQGPNGYDLNTYLTQGSFFFSDTNARANNPKEDNGWMYLVVEQANGGSRVTQTAWYDSKDAAKITYKRQYDGSWSPWYANDNDSVASISQTNGAIQSEVTNRQTGDANTLTQAKDFTTSSISNSESGMRSQITQTSNAILANLGSANLFPNSEFEKDYGYRDKNGSVTLSLSQKNDVDGHLNGTVTVVSNASDYQGYWARNISVSGGQKYSASVLVHYANGGFSNGLAVLDIWFVDKDGNRLANYGSSTSQVDSPYWVKLHIDGFTAPTNAAYLQMSLIVNNAGAGQTATFTRPMLTATEKLQPYAVNNDITTQLSLLKDNWSIGISDNTGALASGVFGDINGMTLNGNTVTINANQTVITGTAFITDAMLTTMSASKLTAGTIDANQINVINLDVSHLTGDISNWVLSQWTSATGSKVTIDGNGLYFAPGTSRMTTNGFEAWRSDSGTYKAMGMVGSYSWQTDSNINGMGLIAKYYDQPHGDQADPYKNEDWGADTIAIGALAPQSGHGYDYVDPFLVFPANNGVGDMYFPGNGVDTILMGRWLSIYTGLNMRGHAITNSSGYSLKENFDSVSGDDALEIFDNTDILTYDYKPDSENMDEQTAAGMKNKVGFVINDNGKSPYKIDDRLVRYGNTRDDSVTVGYLMAAVKELHAKIKKLESLNG